MEHTAGSADSEVFWEESLARTTPAAGAALAVPSTSENADDLNAMTIIVIIIIKKL
jgi:hypothetical protein